MALYSRRSRHSRPVNHLHGKSALEFTCYYVIAEIVEARVGFETNKGVEESKENTIFI